MDFEALKDQWSEIEDRDGIRLSWNTFPSSRMVSTHFLGTCSRDSRSINKLIGSITLSGPYRGSLHPLEGASGASMAAI